MIRNDQPSFSLDQDRDPCDVLIVGAGLAGLTLARHLLLEGAGRVVLIEKRTEIPPARQKVGESLVQVGGYYFGKVLDMEEYMFRDQYMKYNLRFYWKSRGSANDCFEDYSQSYIRNFSNIPCFQLDRNTFEAELVRLNQQHPCFELITGISDLRIDLADEGTHRVQFRSNGDQVATHAKWVVDTTGRGRHFARQMKLGQQTPIRHSSSFLWVDGLLDIERLTHRSRKQIRLHENRRAVGHLPCWLATNHFMGEGFWFWVIPLRGKTSLGLVYDHTVIPREQVGSPEQLIDWVCREFPVFADDLRQRRVIDFSAIKDFSHGCGQTISPARWAMSGEAGRFHDPLYSPGSDFISLHNSLIVDAILTEDRRALAKKCRRYETLMKAWFDSWVPTFSKSYDALGDQETFTLKYTWELSIYFAFFVFPFTNDLLTDPDFVPAYLNRFSRLGAINHRLQQMISDYFQWKKQQATFPEERRFHDFTNLEPLRAAEKTFYEVGVTADQAKEILDRQLNSLMQLARFVVAYIYASVLDDDSILTNKGLIESIDFKQVRFDIDQMRRHLSTHAASSEIFDWHLDPHALWQFSRGKELRVEAATVGEGSR